MRTEVSYDAFAKHAFIQDKDVLVKLRKLESINQKKMSEFCQSIIECRLVPNSHSIAAVLNSIGETLDAIQGNVSTEQSFEPSFSQKSKKSCLMMLWSLCQE